MLTDLPAPDTFVGAALKAAYESAAKPDQGPLPADELEDFKAQVRAMQHA